jgi:hypothetical protein
MGMRMCARREGDGYMTIVGGRATRGGIVTLTGGREAGGKTSVGLCIRGRATVCKYILQGYTQGRGMVLLFYALEAASQSCVCDFD